MTYSINIQPFDDPYIKIAEEAVMSITWCLPHGYYSHLEVCPQMVPWCQIPAEGCHNVKTCSKDSQYYICSNRGINGMSFITFSYSLLRTCLHSQASGGDYDTSFNYTTGMGLFSI